MTIQTTQTVSPQVGQVETPTELTPITKGIELSGLYVCLNCGNRIKANHVTPHGKLCSKEIYPIEFVDLDTLKLTTTPNLQNAKKRPNSFYSPTVASQGKEGRKRKASSIESIEKKSASIESIGSIETTLINPADQGVAKGEKN